MTKEPTVRDEQIRKDLAEKRAEKKSLQDKFREYAERGNPSGRSRHEDGRFQSEGPGDVIRQKKRKKDDPPDETEIRFELKFSKPRGKGRYPHGQNDGLPPAWLRKKHRKKPRKSKETASGS